MSRRRGIFLRSPVLVVDQDHARSRWRTVLRRGLAKRGNLYDLSVRKKTWAIRKRRPMMRHPEDSLQPRRPRRPCRHRSPSAASVASGRARFPQRGRRGKRERRKPVEHAERVRVDVSPGDGCSGAREGQGFANRGRGWISLERSLRTLEPQRILWTVLPGTSCARTERSKGAQEAWT